MNEEIKNRNKSSREKDQKISDLSSKILELDQKLIITETTLKEEMEKVNKEYLELSFLNEARMKTIAELEVENKNLSDKECKRINENKKMIEKLLLSIEEFKEKEIKNNQENILRNVQMEELKANDKKLIDENDKLIEDNKLL